MKQVFGAGRFVTALLLFLCVGIEASVLFASEQAESSIDEIIHGASEEELLVHVKRNSLPPEDAKKLFWHAANKGYLKVVEHLVTVGSVDVCAPDHEGRTALHRAAENGHVSIIRSLMKNGALINVVDKDGYTPVLDAALSDQFEAFLELVRLGANLTVGLPNGSNVLHVAVAGNSLPIVSYFVRIIGHDTLYLRNNAGETPVHCAARLGHVVLLMYFYQHNRGLMGERDAHGVTPLLAALEAKNSSVARYLMNVAWDGLLLVQDSRGRTPLHLAAEQGLSDLVSHLIEVRGVPVDYKNCRWETPLNFAAGAGQLDVVKYLIVKGADPEHMDQDECTPLLNAALEGEINVVRYLVEHVRVDLTAENAEGGTALHCAAESGSLELVKFLIERCGIGVDTVNVRSETPLGWAVLNNHLDIAAYLIARGARIEEQPGHHVGHVGCWSRPLHLAILEKAFDGMMYLIKRGAKLYTIDFARAAENGCLAQLVRELIGPIMNGGVNPEPFLDFLSFQARKPAFDIWLRSVKGAWCAHLYMLLVPQLDAALHLSVEDHVRLMRIGALMHSMLRDIQKRMQKQVPRDVAGLILCDFLCFPKMVFQVPVSHSGKGYQHKKDDQYPRDTLFTMRSSQEEDDVCAQEAHHGRKRDRNDADQEDGGFLACDDGVEGADSGRTEQSSEDDDVVDGAARAAKRQRRG